MTEQEILEKINATIKNEIDTNIKNSSISREEVAEIKQSLENIGKEAVKNADFDAFKKQANDLLEGLKSKVETGATHNSLNFNDLLEKALKTKAEDIKNIKNGGNNVKLNLKEATTITTNNIGAGVLQGMRLPGIESFDRNEQNILDLITIYNGGQGSNPFSWIELVNPDGGAAAVAEGAAKPYYDFDVIEGKATAEAIAAVVPITKQTLLSMPIISDIVNKELTEDLREKFQKAVLIGNGTPPNIKGIKYFASAWALGSMEKVTNPDIWDAITAILQFLRTGKGTSVPNAIVVNPVKFFEMLSTKTTTGYRQFPNYVSIQGNTISVLGTPIIMSNDLAADEFIVGDFRKYMLNIVEDVTIEIGLINDQFLKNQLSIRAEMYVAGGVKSQHYNKLCKGDFATVKAAISKS